MNCCVISTKAEKSLWVTVFIATLLASLTACSSTKGGEANVPAGFTLHAPADSVIVTDEQGNVVKEETEAPQPEALPAPRAQAKVQTPVLAPKPEPFAEPEPEPEAQPAPRVVERPVVAEQPAPPATKPRRRSVPRTPPSARPVSRPVVAEQPTPRTEREVSVQYPTSQPVPVQRPTGPVMLPIPGATPGSYAQAPLLSGQVHQVDYEPAVRPRRYGFDYLLTNNQRGGRLLAVEYLNVKFTPCAGYPTLTMTVIDEATKRPVSVIPMGAQACFTMANGRCPGGQASCEVKFRLVRYTAPRSQVETMPLPGGGFAQRTVLYATRLPESNSDRPHFRFPSNTSGYYTDLHDPL